MENPGSVSGGGALELVAENGAIIIGKGRVKFFDRSMADRVNLIQFLQKLLRSDNSKTMSKSIIKIS